MLMKKVIRLTESDLTRIVKRVIEESNELNEALKPSQFREYVKVFNRDRYTDIFKYLGDRYEHDKNYYRIYIPLIEEKKTLPVSKVEGEVTEFLKQNGYEVLDYVKGIAKFGDSKNTTTIGKILTKLKADELIKKFISDESRKALTSDINNLMVVISRHPYDIAGSDTDRNWTNCMTLGHGDSKKVEELEMELNSLNQKLITINQEEDKQKIKNKISTIKNELRDRKENGQNSKYLIYDVKEGSLISYLINNNDKNITNPLAVLNIKPYISSEKNDDFILISDERMYGNGRPEFKKTVDDILYRINGEDRQGFYCLKPNLYKDYSDGYVYIKSQEEKFLNITDEYLNIALNKLKENVKLYTYITKNKLYKNIKIILDEVVKKIILILLNEGSKTNKKVIDSYINKYINLVINDADNFMDEYEKNKKYKLKMGKYIIDLWIKNPMNRLIDPEKRKTN